MADYYSVLARAVVDLETSDVATRQELYERARSIIVAELRRQNPRISGLTITRKGAGLEAATRRAPAAPSRSTRRISDPNANARPTEADELGEMPRAIAAMLLGTAYLAAIVGFSGVMY